MSEPNTRNTDLRFLIVGACLIALAVVATYWTAPDGSFHFDDFRNIVRTEALHVDSIRPSQLLQAARDAEISSRPLPNATFAVDWWRGGGAPRAFLQTNVALHLCAGICVFLLLMTIQEAMPSPDRRPIGAGCALLASIVWALHPIQVQVAAYAVQRMASLAAIFVVLSVWAYLKARSGRSPIYYAVCAGSFLLGTLSKENSYITPLLLVLAELSVLAAQGRRRRRRILHLLWIAPLGVFCWSILDMVWLKGPWWGRFGGGFAFRDFSVGERLLTQPRVIARHFGQLLAPLPQNFSINHHVEVSSNLVTPLSTLFAMLGGVAICSIGVLLLRRKATRAEGFFVLWIPLTLLVESSFISLELVFEHRMYLPTIGVAGLLASLAVRIAAHGRTQRWAVIGMMLVLGLLLSLSTRQRLHDWRDEISLWEQAVRFAPLSPRGQYNLGVAYDDAGRDAEAVPHYLRAIELDPRQVSARSNLAVILARQGEHSRARSLLDEAIELDAAHVDATFNRARLAATHFGDEASALRDYRRVLELDPEHHEAHVNRGNLHFAAGRFHDAWTDYDAAIELLEARSARNPAGFSNALAMAYNNRGLVQRASGRPRAAEDDFTQAIRVSPGFAEAYLNRGSTYLAASDFESASRDLRQAVELDPRNGKAHLRLGAALRGLGRVDASRESLETACGLGIEDACRP